MSYRINYGPKKKQKSAWWFQSIISVMIVAICLLCRFSFPQTLEYIKHFMLPKQNESSRSIQVFVAELENGTRFPDAIATFFGDVIHGAS